MFNNWSLAICDVNKNDVIQGAGQLGKKDINQGQANSTGEPPDQKSKLCGVTNLSLKNMDYIHVW
jgi:hypothetical protein